MQSNQLYPEEFKIEAVKQITERGHRVADVSARIGASQHSLYKRIKAYSAPAAERQAPVSQAQELRRPKAELRRVTEERDIKNGRRVLALQFVHRFTPRIYLS